VADQAGRERQALIIVNTRSHALELFRLMAPAGEHVLHLSNNMCPAHKLDRLAEIRARLDSGERCVVVSTQLVEAGVDFDFPVVWRAMGPLDSIAQAAGRCDREGKLTAAAGTPAGRVVVFVPEDDKMPPGAYAEAAAITRTLAASGALSIDDPLAIRRYFDRYYDPGALDSGNIEASRHRLQYAAVAGDFRMIDDEGRSVIVVFNEEAKALVERLRFSGLGVLRRLQRYTVNLNEGDFRKAVALGAVHRVIPDAEVWAACEGFYDKKQLGLRLEPRPADLVV
jgi:CRISPR-associated endonuclease/helicase Cas3